MFNGLRRNVLPVFAGPFRRMFRNFPLPFSTRFLTASLNASLDKSFHSRICSAHCSHLPLHPSVQGSSTNFCKISSLDILLLRSTSLDLSMSQAVEMTSSSTLFPLFITNSAKSVLPSDFCSRANASSSVLFWMFFSTIMFETSKQLRRCDRVRLLVLFARLGFSSMSSSTPSSQSSLPVDSADESSPVQVTVF